MQCSFDVNIYRSVKSVELTQMGIVPVRNNSNKKNMLEILGKEALIIVAFQCTNKSIHKTLTWVR